MFRLIENNHSNVPNYSARRAPFHLFLIEPKPGCRNLRNLRPGHAIHLHGINLKVYASMSEDDGETPGIRKDLLCRSTNPFPGAFHMIGIDVYHPSRCGITRLYTRRYPETPILVSDRFGIFLFVPYTVELFFCCHCITNHDVMAFPSTSMFIGILVFPSVTTIIIFPCCAASASFSCPRHIIS